MSNSDRLIILSDSHLGVGGDYLFRGLSPKERFDRLASAIQRLEVKPSLVVHVGDVAGDPSNHASPAHTQLAQSCFSSLGASVLFCMGNHDSRATMDSLQNRSHTAIRSSLKDELTYSFAKGLISGIVLQSAIETKRAGHISDLALEFLDYELSTASHPLSIFLHHPPVEIGCKWMDDTMLLSDRKALITVLLKHRHKINCVFFGHVHRHLVIQEAGILFYGVPPMLMAFSAEPSSPDVEIDPYAPTGFLVMTVSLNFFRVNLVTA